MRKRQRAGRERDASGSTRALSGSPSPSHARSHVLHPPAHTRARARADAQSFRSTAYPATCRMHPP
eukprot:6182149-Pleurochrysis_carterae.AAC.2